jgi:nickel-dependent lactate racemase
MEIYLSYKNMPPFNVPSKNLLGVYEPKETSTTKTENEIIKEGLITPIGTPRISEMVDKDDRVLIIADDHTRPTPASKILPFVIEELRRGGVGKKNIEVLIGVGTHRGMTDEELINKFGKKLFEEIKITNHEWKDERKLKYIGVTSLGTKIWVNKKLSEANFKIGLGRIVPHSVVGFSGGAKIIQPGVCGGETTGQTHWQSALCREEIFGKFENPIRQEIDAVARKVGLNVIVNVVQDRSGKVIKLVAGDLVKAHREGAKISKAIYGVKTPSLADIVITDSYPCDLELWQAVNCIFAAGLVVKRGGIIIVVASCPEGIVKTEHPEVSKYGYLPFEKVKKLVEEKELKDLTAASQLARVGRVTAEKAKCILVSQGIGPKEAEKIGFGYAKTPQEALEMAFDSQGKDAKIAVLKHGGTILPIFESWN